MSEYYSFVQKIYNDNLQSENLQRQTGLAILHFWMSGDNTAKTFEKTPQIKKAFIKFQNSVRSGDSLYKLLQSLKCLDFVDSFDTDDFSGSPQLFKKIMVTKSIQILLKQESKIID